MIKPLIALLAALALAAPAQAAPFTPAMEADLAFAAEWWGRSPTGCSSYTTELVPDGSLEAEGRATQPEPGTVVPCVMQIEEPKPLALPCNTREVIVHEYGHWLGEGHSPDPVSIMYEGESSGDICAAETTARARTFARRGLRHTRARCARKTHPAQLRWCREQIRAWRHMLATPPP